MVQLANLTATASVAGNSVSLLSGNLAQIMNLPTKAAGLKDPAKAQRLQKALSNLPAGMRYSSEKNTLLIEKGSKLEQTFAKNIRDLNRTSGGKLQSLDLQVNSFRANSDGEGSGNVALTNSSGDGGLPNDDTGITIKQLSAIRFLLDMGVNSITVDNNKYGLNKIYIVGPTLHGS